MPPRIGPGATPNGGTTIVVRGELTTGPRNTSTPKRDRAALRLVSTGTQPWERKTGFGGEHVEITPQVPALVDLVQAIDKDNEAKAALSEFLRVLETIDVPKLLSGGR